MQPTDPILNPTVFIGSFEWREPMTTLTDFLVAMICLFSFIRFYRFKGEKSSAYRFYQYYFLCFAIGMSSAAWFGHGLQAYVGPEFKRIGWACSATGHLFLAFASLIQIRDFVSSRFFQTARIIFFIQYVVFMTLMLVPAFSDFVFAQLSSTVSLIALILPLQIYNYIKTREKGSLIIFLAIIYGVVPGFVYNNQISFSHWFNYHDFSHVLMACFMTFLFFGASRLSMISEPTKS